MTLYTDIDHYCCEVLGARVSDDSLPPGDVRCADIKTLDAAVLAPYRHVHLFCGIGASPLGLAWAGWPDELSIVTGGFPCQDISAAGKGAGLDGSRSGLFWEMMRVVECKRPSVVFAENVGALSARGLRRVVDAMGSLGYSVGAFRVGAWVCGSPQERERWWIVAHAQRSGLGTRPGITRDQGEVRRWRNQPASCGDRITTADADSTGVRLAPTSGGHREAAAPGRPGPRRQLADVRGDGQGAIGLGGERPIPDIAGVRCRWPHVLWVDENGDPVPTPQYDWEPPRLFPGTRTINAAWRLALMGFPTNWLDLPDETLARLCPKYPRHPRKRANWANKQGVKATGNAQVPQCVELVMESFLDAIAGVTA